MIDILDLGKTLMILRLNAKIILLKNMVLLNNLFDYINRDRNISIFYQVRDTDDFKI